MIKIPKHIQDAIDMPGYIVKEDFLIYISELQIDEEQKFEERAKEDSYLLAMNHASNQQLLNIVYRLALKLIDC